MVARVVQRFLKVIMTKDLLVIPAFVDAPQLLKCPNGWSDVLALTPSAMLSLDNVNMAYKTTDDFNDTVKFRKELKNLHREIELVFFELDKVCKDFVDFPYAYSGNIVYFLKVFANLFYLQKLSLKIGETYRKVYMVGNETGKRLGWGDLSYSDLKGVRQTAGLENKVEILKSLLNVETIPRGRQRSSDVPRYLKAKAFLKRFPERLGKGIKEKRFPVLGRPTIFDSSISNKKVLFVVQDGYEVGFLRKHMPEFNFVNPVIALRNRVPSLPSASYDFRPVAFELKEFLERNFPKMRLLIESLFLSYHREVVGRLGQCKKAFERLVDHHGPEALLFSVGIRDVIDVVISYIGNQKDIPVIYFQHGGPSIFTKNKEIFMKYTERDIKTRKTLILNSSVEGVEAGVDGSESVVLGSIMRYQLMQHGQKRSNDRALYCCTPFPFFNYTSLLFHGTDKLCYKVNREVLEACEESSVDIDIKLHPVEEEYCFHYFRQLIRKGKYRKAQVIYGVLAESIMKNYGLIILDSLVSAIVPHALSLKVPIILYLKDLSVVNELAWKDLKKRCYVVQSTDMLRRVLQRYTAGNLPSKWSVEIVDRYIYPIADGHPGPNIAHHIREICSQSRKME